MWRILMICSVLGLGGCLSEDPGHERPAVDADLPDSGPIPDAQPPPNDTCLRTFVYRQAANRPNSVKLAGDFENWQASLRLEDADGDGLWTLNVPLSPGRITYKFVVDGVWSPDPDNPQQIDDMANGFNSVADHLCPFLPACLTDTNCDEAYCRNYRCTDEAPPQRCTCPEPQICRDGQCAEPVECDEENPCAVPQVCRDGRCGPECLSDDECPEGQNCRDLSCFEPECVDDTGCDPIAQVCDEERCADAPCALHAFIFDPGANTYDSVHVSGSFNAWAETVADGGLAMTFDPDNHRWLARIPLENGLISYKFVLHQGANVEWIADPINPMDEDDGLGGRNSTIRVECGPAPVGACGDVTAFDWRDAVMYFVMIDRFYDSDGQADPVPGATGGDANAGPSGQYVGGDLSGITAKLPYLADLGVTAVWLSAPYNNRDAAGAAIDPNADPHTYSGYHGYWPAPDNVDYSDPMTPHPQPAVESRIGTSADLQTFVDQAHAAEMKVLFDYVMNHVDIDSGLYQAHPDWFARRDGRFALCGPENLWDDPFWGTRCAFTDYLPPFDFDNVDARQWSINDAVWWAQAYGIDGYRLDAIKHVALSWLTDLRTRLNIEFPDPSGGRFYLVGETFAYDDPGLLKSFIDPTTKLDGQFDFPFKARLCEALFTPGGRLDSFADWLTGNTRFYGDDTIMTTWIGNHDVPRAIHFASGQIGNCREGSNTGNGWSDGFQQPDDAAAYERLGLSFVVMMTNRGIPLIYYGDEIGLAGGGDPDNRRAMPWDDNRLSAGQLALRNTVSTLGRIRRENKVLGRGQRVQISADQDTWVYRMQGCGHDAPDVTVAINRADALRTVRIPNGDYLNLVTEALVAGGERQLPPRSYLILQTQ